MADLLRLIWPAVEAVQPVFSPAALVRWPPGAHAKLVAAKLIVPRGTARRIRCPECGQVHAATPMARDQPNGTMRVFIVCPEHGRADITRVDRQQWAVNVEVLVETLARELALTGKPANLENGRVWRCGRTTVSGKSRDVLFARGLCRQDAGQMRRAITSAHQPIVLVGSQLPPADFWHGRAPTLIRLSDVATFDGVTFALETAHILGVITQPEPPLAIPGANVTKKELALIVRRQIQADKQTEVTDRICVEAVRLCGGQRAAARFLTEKTGKKVSKERVGRALERAEDADAVVNNANSNSIVRSVASHRRDTRGKIVFESQPDEDAEVAED